jgi:hypothetical protein
MLWARASAAMRKALAYCTARRLTSAALLHLISLSLYLSVRSKGNITLPKRYALRRRGLKQEVNSGFTTRNR